LWFCFECCALSEVFAAGKVRLALLCAYIWD
jgi:hypothetical protein